MSFEKFIENEKADSGKLYSDVIFALEEIEAFVPRERLNQRKFVEYLPVLKTYSDMLKKAEVDNNNKGTFRKLFHSHSSDESILEDFKNKNLDKIDQIKCCVTCKCLTCPSECIMEGCNRCDKSGLVAKCDKKTVAVYTFTTKKLDLNNDKTNESDTYDVLAIVQDKSYNQLFIIIELRGEKFVLYYYPGISEDTYGEISDVEDFNFALNAYEQVDN